MSTRVPEHRNQAMVDLYIDGDTYAKIGKRFGRSTERVRQIVSPRLSPDDRALRARNIERRKQNDPLRGAVTQYLREHPDTSFTDVARAFGVRRDYVRECSDGSWRPSKRRERRPVWTKEAMLPYLRVALEGRRPTVNTYRRNNLDGPSIALVIRKWGTWSAAVAAAGLTPVEPYRTYTRTVQDWDEFFVDEVAAFLATDPPTATWEAFRLWAWGRTPSPYSARALASITYADAYELARARLLEEAS